ncbi:hamartin-like [Anneissia japonica]|uniref:hamartin-like n=1 Tax=Anneissia japonica TaxID=1529436 RepID=UPI00142555B2|nr:hamartin-like [Anneissia japonica]
MAQYHSSSEQADYFHLLESESILVVKDIKEEIQNVLNSGSEPKFVNSLLDYFIRTNSREALDLISGVREPHDKHLLDRLNEYLKQPSTVLQSLTVLGCLIQRQPSWLHKIFKAPVFQSVIKLLKVDTSVPVLMSGVLSITTLLPIYPSLVSPYLNDIFQIFSRLAAWNIRKPGNVPEIYMLHLNVAVYGLFHRLYGMYPCNFVDFLKVSYKDKTKEFNKVILPLLQRMRIHPRLITDTYSKEIDASRWRKMEAHDVLMECAKVSLDYSSELRGSESLISVSSVSENPNMSSRLKQYLEKSQRPTSSPIISAVPTIENTDDLPDLDIFIQSGAEEISRDPQTENPDQSWFSPSQLCPLSTPPLSRPASPSTSHADISMVRSSCVGSMVTPAANTPTPQVTPGGSPRPFIADDLRSRLAHISSGKGSWKTKAPFQKQMSITSLNSSGANSTKFSEGSKSVPSTPYKKTDPFEFPPVNNSTPARRLKIAEKEVIQKGNDCQQLENPSQKDESFEEIKLSEPQTSIKLLVESQPSAEPVSINTLQVVIKQLSPDDGTSLDDDGINKELSLIVNSEDESPQVECMSSASFPMAFSFDRLERTARMHFSSESEATVFPFQSHHSRTRNETYPPLWRCGDSGMPILEMKTSISDNDNKNGKWKNFSAIKYSDDIETDGIQNVIDNQRADFERTDSNEGNNDIQTKDVINSVDGSRRVDASRDPDDLETDSKESKLDSEYTAKSFDVKQILEGNKPSVPVSQRFTPIKDRSVDSLESPANTRSARSSTSDYPSVSGYHSGTTTADLRSPNNNPYLHLFPNMVSPMVNQYQKQSSSVNSTPASDFQRSMDGFQTPNDMSGRISWQSPLSPPELLDLYIELGDNVHSKELSRIPLTSRNNIRWTHFGGHPPADEIELLKGQVFLLHTQLQFERNQREQHEQRNRRLLRKTHKAKAFEEQNSALQMQLKQCQREKQELVCGCTQIRKERDELSAMCEAMRKDLGLERGKNTLMIRELQEAKEELQKLLVEHKQEVEKMKKDWKVAENRVCVLETEKENLMVELAVKKHLESEVNFLNRQLLLMGEVNMKDLHRMEDQQLAQKGKEELQMFKKASKRELHHLMDVCKQKSIQLEAARAKIVELEQAKEQKELSIMEQKRYLESVKSLSKAKMTAMETRVKSFKKIIQRQEAWFFRLQTQIYELQGDQESSFSNKASKSLRRQSSTSRTSILTSHSGSSTPEVITQERLKHVPNSEEAMDDAMYSWAESQSTSSERSTSRKYSLKEETTLNIDFEIRKPSLNELRMEIPSLKDPVKTENLSHSVMSSPPISFSETSPFRRVEPRTKSQKKLNIHKSNSLPRTFKETASKKKADSEKCKPSATSNQQNIQESSNSYDNLMPDITSDGTNVANSGSS